MTHATYQGHLPDGSGIQRHSAGGLYPCVIYQHQCGSVRKHGVLRGVVDTGPVFPEQESAEAFADLLNQMAFLHNHCDHAVELRLKLALNEFAPFAEVLSEHHDRAALILSMHALTYNGHPQVVSSLAAIGYYLWRDQKYLAHAVMPETKPAPQEPTPRKIAAKEIRIGDNVRVGGFKVTVQRITIEPHYVWIAGYGYGRTLAPDEGVELMSRKSSV